MLGAVAVGKRDLDSFCATPKLEPMKRRKMKMKERTGPDKRGSSENNGEEKASSSSAVAGVALKRPRWKKKQVQETPLLDSPSPSPKKMKKSDWDYLNMRNSMSEPVLKAADWWFVNKGIPATTFNDQKWQIDIQNLTADFVAQAGPQAWRVALDTSPVCRHAWLRCEMDGCSRETVGPDGFLDRGAKWLATSMSSWLSDSKKPVEEWPRFGYLPSNLFYLQKGVDLPEGLEPSARNARLVVDQLWKYIEKLPKGAQVSVTLAGDAAESSCVCNVLAMLETKLRFERPDLIYIPFSHRCAIHQATISGEECAGTFSHLCDQDMKRLQKRMYLQVLQKKRQSKKYNKDAQMQADEQIHVMTSDEKKELAPQVAAFSMFLHDMNSRETARVLEGCCPVVVKEVDDDGEITETMRLMIPSENCCVMKLMLGHLFRPLDALTTSMLKINNTAASMEQMHEQMKEEFQDAAETLGDIERLRKQMGFVTMQSDDLTDEDAHTFVLNAYTALQTACASYTWRITSGCRDPHEVFVESFRVAERKDSQLSTSGQGGKNEMKHEKEVLQSFFESMKTRKLISEPGSIVLLSAHHTLKRLSLEKAVEAMRSFSRGLILSESHQAGVERLIALSKSEQQANHSCLRGQPRISSAVVRRKFVNAWADAQGYARSGDVVESESESSSAASEAENFVAARMKKIGRQGAKETFEMEDVAMGAKPFASLQNRRHLAKFQEKKTQVMSLRVTSIEKTGIQGEIDWCRSFSVPDPTARKIEQPDAGPSAQIGSNSGHRLGDSGLKVNPPKKYKQAVGIGAAAPKVAPMKLLRFKKIEFEDSSDDAREKKKMGMKKQRATKKNVGATAAGDTGQAPAGQGSGDKGEKVSSSSSSSSSNAVGSSASKPMKAARASKAADIDDDSDDGMEGDSDEEPTLAHYAIYNMSSDGERKAYVRNAKMQLESTGGCPIEGFKFDIHNLCQLVVTPEGWRWGFRLACVWAKRAQLLADVVKDLTVGEMWPIANPSEQQVLDLFGREMQQYADPANMIPLKGRRKRTLQKMLTFTSDCVQHFEHIRDNNSFVWPSAQAASGNNPWEQFLSPQFR
eukprot:g6366.t1